VDRLAEDVPTLVGIDHGFSFPLRYFETYSLKPDWPAFPDDFRRHWPTDEDNTYVDFVRDGTVDNGAARWEMPTNDEEKTGDVLYQGIAARAFERSFQLADYVKVKGASLENGLLHIDLVREIPEAMKPRSIPIASSSKLLEVMPAKGSLPEALAG
jgi:Hsp20/alpha crystallin family